jgi:hypothetical protein
MDRPPPAESSGTRAAVELAISLAGLSLLWFAWRADWHWYEVHATWCYCAQYGRQVFLWCFWRTVAAVTGTLLVAVVRPALGRRAAQTSARELAVRAAHVVGAIVLALAVSEAALHRWLRTRKVAITLDADGEADARCGWRPIASHVTVHRVGGRIVRFVTDANGYRVRSPEDHFDFAQPTILSTGESVAAGYGLDYDETYVAMLREALGVQVVNVAMSGYANDQAYMRLADSLSRTDRPLATLTMVHPMALDRSTYPDRPHLVATPEGTLALEPRRSGTLLGRVRLLPLLQAAIGYHSDEAVRRVRAILAAVARDSAARGAFALFILLDWPTCLPDETGAPSIERTLFGGLGLTHLRVHVADDGWDPGTGHPNARGNRTIADAVARALMEHGIAGLPEGSTRR